VTEFGRERPIEPGGTEAAARTERTARDLVKAIKISRVAYEAIRSGQVGAAGSTGGVRSMGLDTALSLAERLLSDR